MNLGSRIKFIRKELNLTQSAFAERIGLKQAAIGLYENNQRNVVDRTISDICREFNVNEEWLRTGNGDMFIEPDTFSLDEYVKKQGATELEFDIVESFVKSYFDMPIEFRHKIISNFKNNLSKLQNDDSTTNNINEEVEAYRKELEAEEKGATLSASEKLEEI